MLNRTSSDSKMMIRHRSRRLKCMQDENGNGGTNEPIPYHHIL